MAGSTGSGSEARWSRWRMAAWTGALLLLLLPALAMQVTDQVSWDAADFVLFGALLLAAGGAFELAARRSSDARYLAGAAVAVAGAFVLVWMNLAGGLIGDEGNAANRLVGVVLAIGAIGAAIARLRPNGMARAMTVTAIAQALVGLAAVAAGFGSSVLPTAFFTLLWLASAGLFARAGRGA
jgi:hypothetical protein